jgi:putative restriction endonuclease
MLSSVILLPHKMRRRDWTRNELIVAFNLYCKLPFGKIHTRNPQVIELAKALGRTPSAVSWKLANFARLDPSLRKRNVMGASHGAHAEIEIWDEFNGDWDSLAFESEHLLRKISARTIAAPVDFPEGATRDAIVRVRVNQGFFRAAVLAAYSVRCCITGLSISELLNASHIVPWSVDIKNRTNPRNGLCLNAIHDRAFDCGLVTITPALKVKVSPKLKSLSAEESIRDFFVRWDGHTVSSPSHFVPAPEFLRYHNEHVFRH